MLERATRQCVTSPTIDDVPASQLAPFLAHGEHVQQPLGGMLVCPSPALITRRIHPAGQKVRGARGHVADDDQV